MAADPAFRWGSVWGARGAHAVIFVAVRSRAQYISGHPWTTSRHAGDGVVPATRSAEPIGARRGVYQMLCDRLTVMIVRVSEARVRPERFEAFRDMIVSAVREFPGRYPGLVDHEVLLAPPDSLLYVSRWRGEEDLVNYAGEHWREQPVVLPGEDEYLVEPLRVRHFERGSLS